MKPATAPTRALHQIKVASPCTVPWEQMKGDEQVRYCGTCDKNVFNLSAMSEKEASTLLAQGSDRALCVRFYRRADGTLLTSDCSAAGNVDKRQTWRALPGLAGMAVLALSVAGCTPESKTPENTVVPGPGASGHWIAGGMG